MTSYRNLWKWELCLCHREIQGIQGKCMFYRERLGIPVALTLRKCNNYRAKNALRPWEEMESWWPFLWFVREEKSSGKSRERTYITYSEKMSYQPQSTPEGIITCCISYSITRKSEVSLYCSHPVRDLCGLASGMKQNASLSLISLICSFISMVSGSHIKTWGGRKKLLSSVKLPTSATTCPRCSLSTAVHWYRHSSMTWASQCVSFFCLTHLSPGRELM